MSLNLPRALGNRPKVKKKWPAQGRPVGRQGETVSGARRAFVRGRPIGSTSWAGRGLSRQGRAPGKARNLEKHGQDQKRERHHEHRNLSIRLGGETGRLGGGDTNHQCRCAQRGANGAKNSHEPETFAPGGRRYVHGIDVLSSLPMLTDKHRKAVRL